MAENRETADIYMLSKRQVVTVGEQVIDINHIALWGNIERLKVADPVGCFFLVNRVFHHFLNKEREARG